MVAHRYVVAVVVLGGCVAVEPTEQPIAGPQDVAAVDVVTGTPRHFVAMGTNTQNPPPSNILLADVDGDQRTDLVQYVDQKIFVQKADGERSPILDSELPSPISRMFAGDFAGIGKQWLCALTQDGKLRCYASGPTHTELWSVLTQRTPIAPVEDIIVADFNGDGRDDVLLYDKVGKRLRVLCLKAGGTSFVTSSQINLTAPSLGLGANAQIRVGDFNGDGRADLVVFSDGLVSGYFAQGSPTLQTVSFSKIFTVSAAFVDVNDQITVGRVDNNAVDEVVLHNTVTRINRVYSFVRAGLVEQPNFVAAPPSFDGAGGTRLFWGRLGAGSSRDDVIEFRPSAKTLLRADAAEAQGKIGYDKTYEATMPSYPSGWVSRQAKPFVAPGTAAAWASHVMSKATGVPYAKAHVIDVTDPVDATAIAPVRAIPDDAIDDYEAIQSAIDRTLALRTTPSLNRAAIVVLPPGKYLLSKPLVIHSGTSDNSRVISLEGNGATLLATAPMAAVLEITAAAYVSISNLRLDANNQADNGIKATGFGGGYQPRIENVVVERAKQHGVNVSKSTCATFSRVASIGNGGDGFRFEGANASVCDKCVAIGNGGNGAFVTNLFADTGAVFWRDFIAAHNNGNGMHLKTWDGVTAADKTKHLTSVTVTGGTFYKNRSDGLLIDCENTLVDGVTFVEPPPSPSAPARRAIRFGARARAIAIRNQVAIGSSAYATIGDHSGTGASAHPPEMYMSGALGPKWTILALDKEPVPTIPATVPNFTAATAVDADLAARLDASWSVNEESQKPWTLLNASDYFSTETADASAKLKSAIAAAVSVLGPVRLVLPHGTYSLATPIEIGSVTGSDPLVLDGAFATLQSTQALAALSPVKITGSRPIVLRRLVVNELVKPTPSSLNGIHVNAEGTVSLQQVAASYSSGDGVWVERAASAQLLNVVAYANGNRGISVGPLVKSFTCTQCQALLNLGNGIELKLVSATATMRNTWSEKNKAAGIVAHATGSSFYGWSAWAEGNAADATSLTADATLPASNFVVAGFRTVSAAMPETRAFRVKGPWQSVAAYGNGIANNGVDSFLLLRFPKASMHDEVFGNFTLSNALSIGKMPPQYYPKVGNEPLTIMVEKGLDFYE